MKHTHFPWPLTVLLITLGCLVYSYTPLLQLGTVAGVHIDISLLYIAVIIVALSSVIQLWNNRRTLASSWSWRLLIAFSLYTSIAALWSPNPTRALFTVCFLWLMVVFASSIIVWWPKLKKESKLVKRIFTIGFGISGIFALWQIFGDALGVSNAFTLLPPMYQSGHFGVARPVGFALEPQFFASLLLIPFAWLSYNLLKGDHRWKLVICLIATSTLLILTLSRGGLVTASVIAIILVITLKKWSNSLLFVGVSLTSLVVGCCIIAFAASIDTRDSISGYTANQRVLNQLTLGTVQLPSERAQTTTPIRKATSKTKGYVESSTTSRLSMFEKSIVLWHSTPATILFGVGTGGLGIRLHQENSHIPASSIANNYYLEMLAELGTVGIALFGTFIASLLASLARSRQWLVLALLLGFLVQWCFFSGNANVIHVWAVLGLSIIISSPQLQRRLIQ